MDTENKKIKSVETNTADQYTLLLFNGVVRPIIRTLLALGSALNYVDMDDYAAVHGRDESSSGPMLTSVSPLLTEDCVVAWLQSRENANGAIDTPDLATMSELWNYREVFLNQIMNTFVANGRFPNISEDAAVEIFSGCDTFGKNLFMCFCDHYGAEYRLKLIEKISKRLKPLAVQCYVVLIERSFASDKRSVVELETLSGMIGVVDPSCIDLFGEALALYAQRTNTALQKKKQVEKF